MNINGSGELIALKITTTGIRTITITVDGSTYRTYTTSGSEVLYAPPLELTQVQTALHHTCNISFSENLTVSATGSVTVQFLYETEV